MTHGFCSTTTKSMTTSRLYYTATVLLLWFTTNSVVRAKYDFSVLFYEYFNPTGLCAECGTGGTPACCDNFNFTSQCLHIVESCDTAFRFIQRPYGALVETAPDRGYDDYTRSHTNREHEVFNEGKGGFLSLENPHTRANLTAWNGRIQLHIDVLDRAQGPDESQKIIDRFPIDLELQLGANFTQQRNYTGLYNISKLGMSFKVECSQHFYSADCTKFCLPVEGQYFCESDGSSLCIQANRDPSTLCTSCLSGLDILTNCTECLPAYDPTTNCNKCRKPNLDPGKNCSTCLQIGYDPQTNCTQCLPWRDPSTNCTQCLTGRDPSTNCVRCLQGYDLLTNCSKCQPGQDPATNCTKCLPQLDPDTNCTEVLLSLHDVHNNETSCPYGYDPETNCTKCFIENRDPSTGCIECFSGFVGNNCIKDPCLNELCKNGATCIPNTTTGDYYCQCMTGFAGETCTSKTTRTVSILELILAILLGVSATINVMAIFALLCKCLCSKSSKELPNSIGKTITAEEDDLRNNDGYGVIGLDQVNRLNEESYYNVTELDCIQPIHSSDINRQSEGIYEFMD